MGFRINQRFAGATGIAAMVVSLAAGADAAVVHHSSIPAGVNAAFSKTTHNFTYLEGETSTQGASDTLAASDVGKTFYRSSASVSLSHTAPYDNARYVSYGADGGSQSNINVYWEDVATGLQPGTYDVFVRAYQSVNNGVAGDGVQAYTLFTGTDKAAADTATASGTVSTPSLATPTTAWHKLATLNLTSGTDTFRLRIDTTKSTVRFDTLLFAGPQLPEPSFALMGAAGLLSLAGRRRRQANV